MIKTYLTLSHLSSIYLYTYSASMFLQIQDYLQIGKEGANMVESLTITGVMTLVALVFFWEKFRTEKRLVQMHDNEVKRYETESKQKDEVITKKDEQITKMLEQNNQLLKILVDAKPGAIVLNK